MVGCVGAVITCQLSIVTPVLKAGRSCDVANYRPISLTCVACKVMERVKC